MRDPDYKIEIQVWARDLGRGVVGILSLEEAPLSFVIGGSFGEVIRKLYQYAAEEVESRARKHD